jgi:nucleoside phosphorylase
VRSAQRGRQALGVLRPRGITGVLRARPPLALQLYSAARDGRLVWRGPGALALLEPPAGARVGRGGPAAVRWGVEQWWEALVFCAPAVVLVLTLPVPLGALLPRDVAAGVRAATLLGVLAWTVTLSAAPLVNLAVTLLRRWREPAGTRIEVLTDRYWTLRLLHGDPAQLEALLQQAERQFGRLVDAGVRRLGSRRAASRTLVCLRDGITTGEALREVAVWSRRPRVFDEGAASVTVRMQRGEPPPHRPSLLESGGFVLWYAAVVAAALALTARAVARAERADCAGEACAGRPATYGAALRWLGHRLVLDEPAGVRPVSRAAAQLGWLTGAVGVLSVALLVVAAHRYHTYRRRIGEEDAEVLKLIYERSLVLVLVANDTERDAVLAAAATVTGTRPRRRFLDRHTVVDLGTVEGADLVLAQTEQSAIGLNSAADATATLIDVVAPDYLIMVGICYGLHEGAQQLGDVLVCSQVRLIDHHSRTSAAEPGLPDVIVNRGDFASPSPRLLDRCRSATMDWPGTVHVGPMLTSNMLVNSEAVRDELLRHHPEAVGGEMEAAGVYAAAERDDVDWIMIKAISDWAHRKENGPRAQAARNAADFLLHMLGTGALADRPSRRRQA